jgi:thymidine phosphorylase
LIDMPVGPTAKVRTDQAARTLSERLHAVGQAIGLTLRIHVSDGSAPVGRGIGPALEAHDLLAVLRRDADGPIDLRERALDLAGALLDLAKANGGKGRDLAGNLLDSGAAEAKFLSICEAQGGFREPGSAPHQSIETADVGGAIKEIDNRRIAKIAKLAGAPGRKHAGVRLLARPGDVIEAGQPLYEIHAETRGELGWAQDYARAGASPFQIGDAP